MPILACVNITADITAKRLILTGTNLDLTIICGTDAEISQPGSLCINARLLERIVAAAPGETIDFSGNSAGTRLSLKSGTSSQTLLAFPANEWPATTRVSEPVALTFKQEDLLLRLGEVKDAQSDDETRYVLNGVFITRHDKGMNFVATDGRRLHVSTVTNSEVGGKESIILPSRSVVALASLIVYDANVTIATSQRHMEAVIESDDGQIVLISKVVEGNYPNWKQVMPKSERQQLEVERVPFLEAVNRAALMANEKSNSVRLKIEDTTISLTAQAADLGDSREMIMVANANAATGEFALNPGFLIEALGAVEKERITLSFGKISPESEPIGVAADGFESIIMPVRLT